VISRSPGELEPVFEAMLANATRLYGAKFGTLTLCDGDAFHNVALYNLPPAYTARLRVPFRPHPKAGLAQVARTKQTAHTHVPSSSIAFVHDLADVYCASLSMAADANQVQNSCAGLPSPLHAETPWRLRWIRPALVA